MTTPVNLNEAEPPVDSPFAAATAEERALLRHGVSVGFDGEEALHESGWNEGEFSRHLCRVSCPLCGRRCAPLLARSTRWLESSWAWMGLEYRYPFTDYLCRCPGCHEMFRLHLYWPQ